MPLALTSACLALAFVASNSHAGPADIIFDTDIGPDCDDVGAVAVLHGLADRGEARLLAMMVCTSSPWGAPCLDALNTYFGRPDIPIGTLKDAGFLDKSGYPEAVARRYPHDLASGVDAPDATGLYRKVLAAQPDGSVTIAAVGPLRNLHKLLVSGPDALSPLSGKELVAKKVTRLVCMGGIYPGGRAGQNAEWNFEQDGEAAHAVVEQWPTPALFSGGELGSGIMAGRALALHAPEYDPVTLAYGLYVGYGRDRETWDLTGALAAVRDTIPSLKMSGPGTNRVDEKGRNVFTPDPAGRHRYLILDGPKQPLEDLLEELMITPKTAPIAFDHELTLFVKDGFGSASAQGSEHGDASAGQAFDRSTGSAWYGKTGGSWLQFSLPDGRARAASSYVIARKDGRDSWKLSGSNDGGKSWTVLDSRTDEAFAENGEPRQFRFQNTAPFVHYRLEFPAESKPSVPEFSLFERIERAAGVAVTSVAPDRSTLTLPTDTSTTLNAAVLPSNAFNQEVTWTSSAPDIARISPLGSSVFIHGIAPGTATVTVTSNDRKRSAACQITVAPGSLPAPWKYVEINAPDVPGGASSISGVFTVTGGGETVKQWWKRKFDQFGMLAQPLAGDGSITARLVAQSSTASEAQAGVTLRQSLEKNSPNALLTVHSDGETYFIWSDKTTGDDPGELKFGKHPLPIFLKLERHGNEVLAYLSSDGIDWGQPAGKRAVEFTGSPVFAGVAVTASMRPTTNTATVDHLSVIP